MHCGKVTFRYCYNIEIGHPVFDRIELNPIS